MLHSQTALITGASRGIGCAIAKMFAHHGANIAFTDLHADEASQSLLRELTDMGVKAAFYEGNAASFESAHHIIDQVVQDFGTIDILVCNAGITQDTLMLRMSEAQWDDVMEVNLKSMFNYCHAVTPHMVRQHKGNIIAMSSVVGIGGHAGQANYAASKAGAIGLIKSLSKELGARNIRANAIAPGYIDTEMTRQLPQNIKDDFCRMVPMHRAGSVEEVASAALFLASDMSSYISGQVIQVDGGM